MFVGIWKLGCLFSNEFGPYWAHKLEQCKKNALLLQGCNLRACCGQCSRFQVTPLQRRQAVNVAFPSAGVKLDRAVERRQWLATHANLAGVVPALRSAERR